MLDVNGVPRSQRSKLMFIVNFPVYNTIMAVATGLALVLLVVMASEIARGRWIVREAWASVFIALGSVLALTGGVMTLTWPLKSPTQFDNIVFGEPCLALGVMLLIGGYLLGSRRFWADDAGGVAGGTAVATAGAVRDFWLRLSALVQPLSWFAAAMGLGLFGIAAAGFYYKLFAAPPTEPLSGRFSNHPMIEASFISTVYTLTGIGCVLLPFALIRRRELSQDRMWRVIAVCWGIAGLTWIAFGALNYFTHIGLVVNGNA
jgi:uncharacterized membrane protein